MTTSTQLSSKEDADDSSTALGLTYDSDEESFEHASNNIQHEAVAVMNSLTNSIQSSYEPSSVNIICSTTATPMSRSKKARTENASE